jgi:uracil-DNA glycosylase
MTIDEYFGDWLKVIDQKELYKVLRIVNSLYEERTIMPAYEDIFKAFLLCPYNELKVVFIGQDPYPQSGVATGILFGNKEGTINLSPSLEVVKEACIDYTLPHNHVDFDVTLESWARQGILMLNAALTVELNTPTSHTMIWRPFISKLLQNLSIHESGIVYALFGNLAQTFKPYINGTFNDIFEIKHPAYYARNQEPMPKEFFTGISKTIEGKYGKPIKWYEENEVLFS